MFISRQFETAAAFAIKTLKEEFENQGLFYLSQPDGVKSFPLDDLTKQFVFDHLHEQVWLPGLPGQGVLFPFSRLLSGAPVPSLPSPESHGQAVVAPSQSPVVPVGAGGDGEGAATRSFDSAVSVAPGAPKLPSAIADGTCCHGPGVQSTQGSAAVPDKDKRPPACLARCVDSVPEFLEREFPETLALLKPFVIRGNFWIIFGKRGSGKSIIAMLIAQAIAEGIALGPWSAGDVGGCKVLYVDGEMQVNTAQDRFRQFAPSRNISVLHHYQFFREFGDDLDISNEEHRLLLTDYLVTNAFAVLILDNLSSLSCALDENSQLEWEPIKKWFKELGRNDITVILVHHAGKFGTMRGHTKREDGASNVMKIESKKCPGDSGATFVTTFDKPCRESPEPLPDVLWSVQPREGDLPLVKWSPIQSVPEGVREVVDAVRAGRRLQADITEAVGKNKGSVSKWLKTAMARGLLEKRGNEYFPIDPAGPEVD